MRLHLDPSKWPSGVFGSAAHTASVLDAIRAVMVSLWAAFLSVDHKKGAMHCLRVHVTLRSALDEVDSSRAQDIAGLRRAIVDNRFVRSLYDSELRWDVLEACYRAMATSPAVPSAMQEIVRRCLAECGGAPVQTAPPPCESPCLNFPRQGEQTTSQ